MNLFTEITASPRSPSPDRVSISDLLMWLIDITVITIAFHLSWKLSEKVNLNLFFAGEWKMAVIYLLILPLWLIVLALIRTSRIPTRNYRAVFLLYLQSGIIIFILLLLIIYLTSPAYINRLFPPLLALTGSILLFGARILDFKLFAGSGIRGNIHRNSVIIADDTSIPVIEVFMSDKKLGYRIVVIFTDSEEVKAKFERETLILPEKYIGILPDILEVDMIDEVLHLKARAIPTEIRSIVRSCEDIGVTFRMRQFRPGAALSSAVVTDIADGRYLSFINAPFNSFSNAIRRTIDVNLGILMVISLLPALLIIAVLIKVSSEGPVLIRQPELGWRGRPFNMFRFRTMAATRQKRDEVTSGKSNSEQFEYEEFTGYYLPRIGRFLRKSSLDELPQLLNVIRGEMTLTGHHRRPE